MPTVPKTTDREIVAAARTIIGRLGVDGLSLVNVATAVGIKQPSLYKRFADRAALVEAVREDALRRLAKTLEAASQGRHPLKQLTAIARAYRHFGKDQPELFRLIVTSSGEPTEAARAAIAPVFRTLTAAVSEEAVLPAARTLTAFLHGFIAMENNGSFRLGGSVDRAFEFGLDAILAGVQVNGASPRVRTKM